MWNMSEDKPVTGEILELDEALNALFDVDEPLHSVGATYAHYIIPVGDEDIYHSVWYNAEFDQFEDYLGYELFMGSWVCDFNEWVLMEVTI